MTKVQSICLVTEGYPAKGDPFFPFVELLCQEFSRNGISVTVICPQSITYCLKYRIKPHPWKRVDQVEGGIPIKVYQPYCLLPSTFLVLFLLHQELLFQVKQVFSQVILNSNIEVNRLLYSRFSQPKRGFFDKWFLQVQHRWM